MTVYADRLTAVRALFDAWQVEALVVASPANRRWLSGFTGSSGQLLITAEQAIIATDSRYWERVKQEAPDFTLFKHSRAIEDTRILLKQANVHRIGIEAQHVTLAAMNGLKKIETADWQPLPQTLEPLRQIKTADELAAITAAAAITDRAMAVFPQLARPGKTERELAWELEKRMREDGADGMAFDIIVASGPNSALPHHASGERPLQPGDPIIVDMGARLDGYCSDMTRSFYLGRGPSEQFQAIYDLVLEAETTAINALRPDMTAKEADDIARDLIAAAGHGDHFGHGLGHGVGLDIHEAPWLSKRGANTQLAQGMVVTVEPGVYLPGWGGIRIEDLVHVTETGAEYLSHCPKVVTIPLD